MKNKIPYPKIHYITNLPKTDGKLNEKYNIIAYNLLNN